jgi:3-oxoacyl-[acyl-carrier protein] reductase
MTKSQARIAVVTGAAGDIGRAIAKRFANDGYRLILVDRMPRVKDVAQELSRPDAAAEHYVVDIAKADEVAAFCKQVLAKHGTIDILVNNAGVTLREEGKKPPAFSITVEDWTTMLAINLTGAFLLIRELVPPMVEKGWGRVINISSLGGRIGSRFNGMHYSASKAGLIGMTKTLAMEVSKSGVTANSIAPGRIATEANKRTGTDPKAIEALIPANRLGTSDEVAAAAAFLASDDAAYITGIALDVNGGFYMG